MVNKLSTVPLAKTLTCSVLIQFIKHGGYLCLCKGQRGDLLIPASDSWERWSQVCCFKLKQIYIKCIFNNILSLYIIH